MKGQTGESVPTADLISHMYSEGIVCGHEARGLKDVEVAKKIVEVFLKGDNKTEHGSVEACMLWTLKRSSRFVKVIVLQGFLHPKAVLSSEAQREVASFEGEPRNCEILYEAKKKNA